MLKRRKKRDCRCSRRRFGRPKIGRGVCYGYGSVREAVRDRIAGKLLVRTWRIAVDLEDVEA
jgi:hypothetical protein